ncbi:MAG: DUF4260 domain-containing protein [Chloroflexota bacterium]|nr:DUF4260 domain-containing protein [Chloroflexota bacterium]
MIGSPRRWLLLEGATLVVGSLLAYSATGSRGGWSYSRWFVPDLFMLGYLGGTCLGAVSYNFAHSIPLPAVMVALSWWQGQPVAVALGLVWLAHIGADRLMGYGLKYDDNFQHPHLGWLGRHRPEPALREHVEASSS